MRYDGSRGGGINCNRFFFEIASRIRDDTSAKLFAECVLLSAEYVYGPLTELSADWVCHPFNGEKIDFEGVVQVEELEKLIAATDESDRDWSRPDCCRN